MLNIFLRISGIDLGILGDFRGSVVGIYIYIERENLLVHFIHTILYAIFSYSICRVYRPLGTYILKRNLLDFGSDFWHFFVARFLTTFLARFSTRSTVLQLYRVRKYSVQFF